MGIRNIEKEKVSYIKEYGLNESETYKKFEKSTNTSTRAKELIMSGQLLKNTDMELPYMQVKQHADALSKAAVSAFDSGDIRIIYTNNPKLSLSKTVPFLSFTTRTGDKTYIFINAYSSIMKEGQLNIDSSVLNVLLKSAYIANRMKYDSEVISNNAYVQKITMDIYTKLVMRILLKEYGFGPDKVLVETITYYINRFFIENVYPTNIPDSLQQLAVAHITKLDELEFDTIKNNYTNAGVTNLTTLMELIKTTSYRMDKLTYKLFLDKWLLTYYPPSLLATDTFEYLIFMINSVLGSGNKIISLSAQDIVKDTKNIKMLNQELLKLK